MKFGGTSLKKGGTIRAAAQIIANSLAQKNKVVVVASAMAGVTDQMMNACPLAKKEGLPFVSRFTEEMAKTHLAAATDAVKNPKVKGEVEGAVQGALSEMEKVLTGISYVGEFTPRTRDYVLSFGERLSNPLLWGALRDLGVDAVWFTGKDLGIVTDSTFGGARPLMNLTKQQVSERLTPLLEEGKTPIVTGYIAADQNGVVTTLGRGGSDYTATIIASCLGVDEVWIWTDVDGFMTADPKIVTGAETIATLSYQEAIEMAYFGAKMMHPLALEAVMDDGIPIRIKNSHVPQNTGTLISSDVKIRGGFTARAISLIRKAAAVTVSGAGMFGAPGTVARVFDILGRCKINILMISQSVSESNISLVVSRENLDQAINALEVSLLDGRLVREVAYEDDVCIVAVVGGGMKGTPGVAARIFNTVAKKGINVLMMAQGSSELNVSFVVRERDGEEAVKALHEEFIK